MKDEGRTVLSSVAAMREDEPLKPKSDLLSKLSIVRFVAPGAVPQMGWCLSEAVIVPLFLSMGVSANQLNCVYAIVPMMSLFLHPACGVLSDRWGFRRPFIFIFYLGFLMGISMIVLLPTVIQPVAPEVPEGSDRAPPPTMLLFLLLGGTCLQDLSLELITDPTRALLNDNLPESQLSQGNSYYSLFSDLACMMTFALSLTPLEQLMPGLASVTYHPHQLALYIATVALSAAFMVLGLSQKQVEEEEPELEVEDLEAAQQPAKEPKQDGGTPERSVAEDEGEGEGDEGEGEGDEVAEDAEDVEEAADEYDETPGLKQLWASLTVLPKAVFVLWGFQYCFMHVTVQLSFWWPTYVGVEIFGGTPGKLDADGEDLYQRGVNFSVAGLLFQATCSFLAGNLVVPANIAFGVANAYMLAGVVFGVSTMVLFFVKSQVMAMVFMGISGVAYPFLQTNPFVLLELLMRDDVAEAEATAVITTSTINAPSVNAFHPPPTPTAALDQQRDNGSEEPADPSAFYSLDATRGVLTSFINMTLPAAQISGALVSYLGIKYSGGYSPLFLVGGAALCFISVVCFLKGWLLLGEDDEDEGEEEEEGEEEAEEIVVVPEPTEVTFVVDSTTTDDEFAEIERLRQLRKEERRARRALRGDDDAKKQGFLLPRTRSDGHTTATDAGGSSSEGRKERRRPRVQLPKRSPDPRFLLYGDGNQSAPESLPSRRLKKPGRISPANTDKGYLTFDENVSRRPRKTAAAPMVNEAKLMDRRSKALRKINAERRRAKRLKEQKQEASYFQQRHARGQVWLPPAADSEATVAAEIRRRMEKARLLALAKQKFGLIASKQAGARVVSRKGDKSSEPSMPPWAVGTLGSTESPLMPSIHAGSPSFPYPQPPASPSSESSSSSP